MIVPLGQDQQRSEAQCGKPRAWVSGEHPRGFLAGMLEDGVGERLIEAWPVGNRDQMLLAEMGCDVDQVRFRQRRRFEQDGSGDRRAFMTREPPDGRLRCGRDLGQRARELGKLSSVHALHQAQQHAVEDRHLIGIEAAGGRQRQEKLRDALQNPATALGRAVFCGRLQLGNQFR